MLYSLKFIMFSYRIYQRNECIRIDQIYMRKINKQKKKIQWKMLIDLLSVLRYLHIDKNIVHRDLNPTIQWQIHHIQLKSVILDWLKFLRRYHQQFILENKAYSEKADVWALGCILYEILQQKPAFQSANPLILAKKIVQLEYEQINQGIYSNELINIVQLCLQKEEDKRPSVNELLEMISLKMIILMDNIKQEKDDLKSELQDLYSKINDQQYEIKKEQQEPGLQVWNIFQKLLHLSLHDNKTINAKNQYLIEQFRKKISKPDYEINIQTELTKLTSLSKEFISYLPKITYEQLFFIIETECNNNKFDCIFFCQINQSYIKYL
ncbi:unnamed protein product [Paramecium primaurelia]|uniref:Protein kinase domain-containing protein n=1 Tax=Paramecium primaurelia TaxID=5886 RepID=A0A8S1JZZ5_PARPR|nr:unnamed protein product [Paramecium primaurelia]